VNDVRQSAYLALAAAILRRALLDAQLADDRRAAAARRWLRSSPFAAELLRAVDAGVDRGEMLEWIEELEERSPVRQKVLAL
jgi:hypothetical protein